MTTAATISSDLPAFFGADLQAVHAAAKARARKVCQRERGVLSIYDLGELIAEIEDERDQAGAALNVDVLLVLDSVARRLKALIPI